MKIVFIHFAKFSLAHSVCDSVYNVTIRTDTDEQIERIAAKRRRTGDCNDDDADDDDAEYNGNADVGALCDFMTIPWNIIHIAWLWKSQ